MLVQFLLEIIYAAYFNGQIVFNQESTNIKYNMYPLYKDLPIFIL